MFGIKNRRTSPNVLLAESMCAERDALIKELVDALEQIQFIARSSDNPIVALDLHCEQALAHAKEMIE